MHNKKYNLPYPIYVILRVHFRPVDVQIHWTNWIQKSNVIRMIGSVQTVKSHIKPNVHVVRIDQN